MLNPGEALASVLSTLHPRDRLPFLRYLTRKGEWAGNRMYLEEITACRDRLASGASDGAAQMLTPGGGRRFNLRAED
jgi:hypothetical protein